jgi:hypothetical protein
MELKISDIVKHAVLMNGDTLFVKLACLMRSENIEKIQEELQAQTQDIKVIILPNAIDLPRTGTK